MQGNPRVNHFLLSPPLHLSLDTGEVLELALAGGKPRKTGLKAGFGSQVCSTPAVRVAPSRLELHKLQPLYRPPQLSSYHHSATNSRSPPRCAGSASQPRTSARAACPLELFFPTSANPEARSDANRRLRRCFGIGCRVVCRAFSGDANNMAAESGSDFQQRRRRRRDLEESEKTELSERELAVAVAVSQENDEENEERWVGPLPVEATLAKKRKGSCRYSTGRIGVLPSPSGRVEFKPDPKRDGVWSFVPLEQRAVLSLLATPYLHVLTK